MKSKPLPAAGIGEAIVIASTTGGVVSRLPNTESDDSISITGKRGNAVLISEHGRYHVIPLYVN